MQDRRRGKLRSRRRLSAFPNATGAARPILTTTTESISRVSSIPAARSSVRLADQHARPVRDPCPARTNLHFLIFRDPEVDQEDAHEDNGSGERRSEADRQISGTKRR